MGTENDAPASGQRRSKFEAVEKQKASLLGDVIAFARQNKKWWLLPIVGVLLVVGTLLVLSTTAAAPFIYTLF
jgi:hypothetical protein